MRIIFKQDVFARKFGNSIVILSRKARKSERFFKTCRKKKARQILANSFFVSRE